MSAALSPRSIPAHQRSGLGPVAVSASQDRPMLNADPARLLRLSQAVRRAAGAYLVEAANTDARAGHPTAESADLRAAAVELEEAAQHLACTAQDAGLWQFLRRRAAGEVAIYRTVRPVVVGDHQHGAAERQVDAPSGVAARALRAVLRVVRRAA